MISGPKAMKYQQIFYPESEYGGFTDVDGTIHFYLRVNALLEKDSAVLDVGCGRAAYQEDNCRIRKEIRMLKNKCRCVIGMDIDSGAVKNPYIDEFRLLNSDRWPLDDASVDMVICDSVLEHIERPETFFRECRRVLNPGGYFCLRTTNATGYVATLARLIPNKFHSKITSKAQSARQEQDVFPAYYRCNTVWKLRRHLKENGFDGCVYGYESEPSYLEFSKFVYWFGTLLQRYTPRSFMLTLFGFARKKQ